MDIVKVNESFRFISNEKINRLVKNCPMYLDAEDEMHVLMFRKILENSLSQGLWWGEVPRIS